MKGKVEEEVKRFFRPEFLNRIDAQIVFHALSKDHIVQIVDLHVERRPEPMLEKGISLEVTTAAKDWLADKGYDPHFGARPLRRVIEHEIEDNWQTRCWRASTTPATPSTWTWKARATTAS